MVREGRLEMHNLALIVILAEQRRRQCPCGAAADRRSGLCRKCQDRNAWRRKTTSAHRKVARRRPSSRARKVRWLFVEAFAGMGG
jgi:hypothetical protein